MYMINIAKLLRICLHATSYIIVLITLSTSATRTAAVAINSGPSSKEVPDKWNNPCYYIPIDDYPNSSHNQSMPKNLRHQKSYHSRNSSMLSKLKMFRSIFHSLNSSNDLPVVGNSCTWQKTKCKPMAFYKDFLLFAVGFEKLANHYKHNEADHNFTENLTKIYNYTQAVMCELFDELKNKPNITDISQVNRRMRRKKMTISDNPDLTELRVRSACFFKMYNELFIDAMSFYRSKGRKCRNRRRKPKRVMLALKNTTDKKIRKLRKPRKRTH